MRYEAKQTSKHKYLLTLTIKEPSLADEGLYRCNAFNPFGDSNANIELKFESKSDEIPLLKFCLRGTLLTYETVF
jgi:hypothetical protein